MVDFGRKQASNKVRFFAFHYRAVREANARFWHKADMPVSLSDVRFTPESGHRLRRLECPLCARSGRSDWQLYWNVRGSAALDGNIQ